MEPSNASPVFIASAVSPIEADERSISRGDDG